MTVSKRKVALVTGSAGFIGFHISKNLLAEGWRVIGLDCLSNYYDVSLKNRRESILLHSENYRSVHEKLEKPELLFKLFEEERPTTVIHLAAQAGVRYSIERPRDYLESNLVGTFELLEAARAYPPEHMLLASTSSVYGANEVMPYKETDKTDYQMSFYAATKKSTENMSHSYSHLYNLPITMFRFFTVYGPWGRPDMALFKFTKAILSGTKIDVYNYGEMIRDFTYIDDLVTALKLLIDVVPSELPPNCETGQKNENISPVAPFRIVNIGNSNPIKLMYFIEAIEKALGIEAEKNMIEFQPGDVPTTWADTELLEHLTKYKPQTQIEEGVSKFVEWYLKFYNKKPL